MHNPHLDTFALRFYQTLPHACSYLPDQEANTLFLDPQQEINADVYSSLSSLGFRRSGAHLYRPNCNNCQACRSVRVKVQHFQPSKQQQRCLKRNQNLTCTLVPAKFKAEHYALYERYLNARHADGDMYPASEEQYRGFLLTDATWASLVEIRCAQGQLVAVAAVDQLHDGLSAIYTFFDPDLPKLSLGVFAVLWQIEQAKQMNLPYLYLGYWVQSCRKMNYKTNYQPLEILDKQTWRELIL